MATTILFDTLDYAKRLEVAGMPAAQAAEHSKMLADVLGKSVAFLGDPTSTERNLVAKIEATELKLENRLAVIACDMNLQKWMLVTAIAISVAVLVSLLVQ